MYTNESYIIMQLKLVTTETELELSKLYICIFFFNTYRTMEIKTDGQSNRIT